MLVSVMVEYSETSLVGMKGDEKVVEMVSPLAGEMVGKLDQQMVASKEVILAVARDVVAAAR